MQERYSLFAKNFNVNKYILINFGQIAHSFSPPLHYGGQHSIHFDLKIFLINFTILINFFLIDQSGFAINENLVHVELLREVVIEVLPLNFIDCFNLFIEPGQFDV